MRPDFGVFSRVFVSRLFVALLGAFVLPVAQAAQGVELSSDLPPPPPLIHDDGVSVFGQSQDLSQPCIVTVPHQPVSLPDALRYSLCSDPKTRQAWAGAQVQQARVTQARAADWPKLDATVQVSRDHSAVVVDGLPEFDSDQSARFRNQALSLSWTLFDFGARTAATRSALDLLRSAQYGVDDALQTDVLKTARDYEGAEAAEAALAAARQDADSARQSLEIAKARMDHGVAAVSDVLQAQTASAQATAESTHAEGDWRSAMGELAIDMGLDPETAALDLVPLPLSAGHSSATEAPLRELLELADRLNPQIDAARAEHLAALAHAEAVRDEGLPSVRLNWKYSRSTQPVSEGLGLPQFGAKTRDNYVGVEVDIPIFDGFERRAQVDEALAQAQEKQEAVEDARQHVMRAVWSGFQDYRTAAADVQSADTVLAVAKQAFEAAQRRYQFGVAGILEVLNAQTALSKARHQRIKALTDWLVARLTLADAVGTLGATVETHADGLGS